MNILITGGAGYIGSHTCVELLNEGYNVIIADNLSNSKMEAVNRIKQITNKNFEFYKVDLLDKKEMEQIFLNHQIDAVIHFAGLKAVGESVSMPIKYYHNNITGTLILCELMSQYNVKKLVFSSSATVYGNPKTVPISEDFPLSTTNPYGATKLMVENILKDLYTSDKDYSIALLRYFNPIGAHESGLIGEDPNGIPNNLMPRIMQVTTGKYDDVKIFGNDYDTKDGTGVRDYIHVVDLAKGHLKALEQVMSTTGIDAYNLGTGRGYSVLELINAVEKVLEIKIPCTVMPRRPGDIATCYANTDYAEKKLKWVATKNLDEMCEDSLRWQKQNPTGY